MSQICRPDLQTFTTVLKTKARVVKVNHYLLHIVLQVNQTKFLIGFLAKRQNNILVPYSGKKWRSALWAFNQSALPQCILVKSDEFENSHFLLYILFKS